VTPREQEDVLPQFKAAFETARERAELEVQRRQQTRVQRDAINAIEALVLIPEGMS
jgi:hypothetical protein